MKEKTKRTLTVALLSVFVFIGALAIFSSLWYSSVYGNLGFAAVLYTLTSGFGGTASSLVKNWMLRGLLPSIALTVVETLLVIIFINKKKIYRALSVTFAILLSFSLFFMAAIETGFDSWAINKMQKTNIYEKEYVSPDSVKISFPKEKRNLIYIFMESMETSYFSESEGGGEKENVIPELYNLASQNINFSQNNSVGGGRDITGAKWTVGAMIAQTSGIPLSRGGDAPYHPKGFLKGAKGLTEVLKENGYYQALMVGSDSTYGGRKQLYETHGADKVYDIYTAYEDNIVPKGYWQWWGMEDKYLYEYAKKELTEISKNDEPFALTMLTVDTHHVNGFICSECPNKHSSQYSNVLSCASNQLNSFIEWVKQQDFYENTTIVITGDHLTMDNQYIINNVNKNYTRRLYNCFINSLRTENTKNRDFVSFDMLPTTLSAIGAEIEGQRLGFGTNLFSGEKTLTEKYGYEKLSNELEKSSRFYDKTFVELS